MKSTIGIVKSKARAQGLSRVSSNPAEGTGSGGAQQNFVIETEAGRSEVDWRNLCPESEAEVGDALTMIDYIALEDESADLESGTDNRYTQVGFILPPDFGDGDPGCYVEYDSFGDPDCTVAVYTSQC